MDYRGLGKTLLKLVGGSENIRQLTHCATRLRMEFYDMSKVEKMRLNISRVSSVW